MKSNWFLGCALNFIFGVYSGEGPETKMVGIFPVFGFCLDILSHHLIPRLLHFENSQ